MCILFLYTGNESKPTLICNNRDEYYNRATIRGVFSSHPLSEEKEEETENNYYYSYAPKDLQGGGSWLHFDYLCHPKKSLRYAIVLNFHHWREYSIFSFHKSHWQRDLSKLYSRGRLVSDFMNPETEITAKEYAEQIFQQRFQYRPFNLIVSDGYNETYYISSSLHQIEVKKLVAGELYGFSNGYVEDRWEKVLHGKGYMQEILDQYLKELTLPSMEEWMRQKRSPASHAGITLENHAHTVSVSPVVLLRSELLVQQVMNYDGRSYTHHPQINNLLEQCLGIMRDDRPLSDITLGNSSLPIMQLAGIFVPPTIIVKDEHLSFWARLSEGKYRLIPKQNDVAGEETEKIDPTEIFGTRTVTVFIYYPPTLLNQQENMIAKSSNNDPVEKNSSGLFTIIETDFMINENDNYNLVPSTNVYTNT